MAPLAKLSFNKIGPAAPWYTLDQSTRGVTITEAVFEVSGKGFDNLTDAARMALALTSACCEIGSGKVFYVHPERMTPGRSQTRMIRAASEFHRVPGLFYIPLAWSDDAKQRWAAMTPRARLRELTSRYGAVPAHMSVLTIDFEIFVETPKVPVLNGLKEGAVTIILSPVPYIGPTASMRAVCGDIDPETLRFSATGWRSFRPWRQNNGLQGVVKELETTFRAAQDDLLFWGSLQKLLIKANMAAAKEGQAYYMKAGQDQDEGQAEGTDGEKSD